MKAIYIRNNKPSLRYTSTEVCASIEEDGIGIHVDHGVDENGFDMIRGVEIIGDFTVEPEENV